MRSLSLLDVSGRFVPTVLIGAALTLMGCDGGQGGPPPARPPLSTAADPPPASRPVGRAQALVTAIEDVPTRYEAAARIAAIGDVHGDLGAARQALVLAGAIDDGDRWVGGKLVVVQTGDQLDRGDEEGQILDLLESVGEQAKRAGGALHVLNGNHEYMNAMGDFRYVTPGGLAAYADQESSDPNVGKFPPNARGRAAAFLPGGSQALRLANRNAVIIVGDTVFAHGGVLPKYAREVDEINGVSRKWLAGALDDPTPALQKIMATDSVVWTRAYSDGTPSDEACGQLGEALRLLSASRMVVGHTVQKEGITSACGDKVWRIDTGMAQAYGGRPSTLIIEDGAARPVYGE